MKIDHRSLVKVALLTVEVAVSARSGPEPRKLRQNR